MTSKLTIHPPEKTAADDNKTTPAKPETLDQVVDAVSRDSRKDSGEYLRQTETPHGGE